VSIDGTSLYHEAKAAGVIYQATLRRELHRSLGFEWTPVEPATGMAELAGVDRESITAWSRRSSQLREWAARNLRVVDKPLSAVRLAVAQKATRPSKPEELAWGELLGQWRADARGVHLDRASFHAARSERMRAARAPFDRAHIAAAAARIDKAAFTRADLVEIIGAQLPIDSEQSPREAVEAAVDELGMRLTAPRARHQREGHERFTLDRILAEEVAVLDLADTRDDRAQLWIRDADTAGLSPDQKTAVAEHRALTLADSTVIGASGGGQDHLDARPARRRPQWRLRLSAGAGPDRQGRRRCAARRRRRSGLHRRQSLAVAAGKHPAAEPPDPGDRR
jgi:hypothetical protein